MNNILESRRHEVDVPLYIDLDGTLLRVDTLAEAVFRSIARSPLSIAPMLRQLMIGRIALKEWLASRTAPDVERLPYREVILDRARDAGQAGRRVVLATAAHESWAQAVADHLGLFDAVLASRGEVNLKGTAKLAEIESDAAGSGFEYLGDSRADLPIFSKAARAGIVGSGRRTIRAARGVCADLEVISDGAPIWRGVLATLRPHQWLKNTLIFVPAVLGHATVGRTLATTLFIAFVTFSMVAASVYTINDMVDIDVDRRHLTKRERPLASGTLPIEYGPFIVVVLLSVALGSSVAMLPPLYTWMLLAYLGLNLLYSFWLKQELMVDVVLLAGMYTWRILAGGVAADVAVSEWLLAVSVFGFTSLAFVKRYADLLSQASEGDGPSGRGYRSEDLQFVGIFGATSGFMTALVFALYINSETVRGLYAAPIYLWLICPLLVYWFARIWFLANRGMVADDPLVFVMRDRVSLLVIALIGLIGTLSAVGL